MYELFVVRFLQTKVMSKKKFRQDSSIYFRRGNNMQGHRSSIAFEVIGTVSNQFNFFYEKNLSVKKAPKRKITNFFSLRSFCARKTVAFVVFCSPFFVLLACFGLVYVFGLRFSNTIQYDWRIPLSTHLLRIIYHLFWHKVFATLIYFYPCALIFICQGLFSFVNTYFHLWESLLIYDHLWESLWSSVRIYFLKSLWKCNSDKTR